MQRAHANNLATLDGWPPGPQCVGETVLGLADLGRLECRVAATDDERSQWTALLEREHFLGAGPLVGARLHYLIRSEHFGLIGGLAFSAAAWRLSARDAFIGWTDEVRALGLHRIVCNSRFVLAGHVRVHGLASRVLSLALRRLRKDWSERYGDAPALVETFIDRSRHRGGCYRAANWTYVGDTTGRGRNDVDHARARSIKAVYVYPLHKHWRRELGVDAAPAFEPDRDDWARHEFAHLRLGDRRLNERVITVARSFAQRSTASLPEANSGCRVANQAACRLFANAKVTMDALLESHYQATLGRCRSQTTILVPQDTTTLNYSAHPLTEGLGPIGRSAKGAQGLIVHDTLAITPQGTPLGLIDVQCWARDPDDHGQRPRGARVSLHNKESEKWLDSHERTTRLKRDLGGPRVVSICDREGDVYELLLAAQDDAAADVLIRAKHPRKVITGGRPSITEWLETQDASGFRTVHVPRRGNQRARVARLTVRFARITVQPPCEKRHLPPVTIDVIRTTEIHPPAGIKPLDWTLLTTVPTTTHAEACERIDWYTRRWDIEVYHRTLKSGCRIEDRQFGHADRLEACLGVDLVVAWRCFALARHHRESPDAPCSVYFENEQWKALLVGTGTDHLPEDADEPTLREAVRRVAKLGGFLGRKNDGEPGTQNLWRGLQRLDDMTIMYRELIKIFTEKPRQGAP